MSILKTTALLSQLSQLETSLNDFSFEELTTDEAASLKSSFNTFRERLEKRILDPSEIVISIDEDKIKEAELSKKEDKSTKLIAHISHEIRTPLNGIIGFADLLREETLNPSQLKKVDAIQTASNNLRDIINEVLEYSKLTSGVENFDNIDFNLHALINDVIYLCQTLIVEKSVDLEVFIAPEIPKTMMGDPSKLSQILLNLIGNAIKFVEKGHIKLNVGINKKNENTYVLDFSVTDTGIGIPKEKLNTIFESYTQADNDTFSKYGGTGLGLSIVKELIEKQNGKISVKSEEGKGTNFLFSIPFKKGSSANIPKKESSALNIRKGKELLRGTKILVFEDNLMNQHLINEQLNKWGCKVYVTADAKEGLSFLNTNSIDVVLMDLKMPNMNGFEVSEEIRSNKKLKNLPIIALSADFTAQDQERSIKSGINDFLLKPYNLDDLLIKVLKQKTQNSLTPESQSLLQKKTIAKDLTRTFDLEKLLKECFGEIEMLLELTRLFKQNIYEFIGVVKISLGTTDFNQITLATHKLKSGLCMFNALHLKDIVIAMEKSCKAKDAQEVTNLFEKFLDSYTNFEKQIDVALHRIKK